MRAICRRAELTPRYFYESFEDLDAALRALVDREFDAGVAAVVAAVGAVDPEAATPERLAAAVDAVLGFVEAVPGRAAVLTGSGALATQRAARMSDLITLLAGFGAEAYPARSPAPGRETALRAAATFAAGGLIASVEAWLRGALPGDRASLSTTLVRELLAVGEAMAQAPAPPSPDN